MASAKNPHERLVARLAAEDRRHARAMKKIQKDSLTRKNRRPIYRSSDSSTDTDDDFEQLRKEYYRDWGKVWTKQPARQVRRSHNLDSSLEADDPPPPPPPIAFEQLKRSTMYPRDDGDKAAPQRLNIPDVSRIRLDDDERSASDTPAVNGQHSSRMINSLLSPVPACWDRPVAALLEHSNVTIRKTRSHNNDNNSLAHSVSATDASSSSSSFINTRRLEKRRGCQKGTLTESRLVVAPAVASLCTDGSANEASADSERPSSPILMGSVAGVLTVSGNSSPTSDIVEQCFTSSQHSRADDKAPDGAATPATSPARNVRFATCNDTRLFEHSSACSDAISIAPAPRISESLCFDVDPAQLRPMEPGKWRRSIYMWKREVKTERQSSEKAPPLSMQLAAYRLSHYTPNLSFDDRLATDVSRHLQRPPSEQHQQQQQQHQRQLSRRTESSGSDKCDHLSRGSVAALAAVLNHSAVLQAGRLQHQQQRLHPSSTHSLVDAPISSSSSSGSSSNGGNCRSGSTSSGICSGSGSVKASTTATRPTFDAQQQQDHPEAVARAAVLHHCGQTEPLPFDDVYPEQELRHCQKIGEGVYGEVFMRRTGDRAVVLKIIPIEGALEVNGEPQKLFAEISSEIVITAQLSGLRHGDRNATGGFVELLRVRCVRGAYPQRLLDLWELYRDNKGTENDHPEAFDEDQLYIVLELANAGEDLEAFRFSGAGQSLAALKQIALTLAVAEEALQFEHRDLHWGNILITRTRQRHATYRLRGQRITVPTHGICATIIDYTLSRIALGSGGTVIYNNLAVDEDLFHASGDYQFEIYRLMRARLLNVWRTFQPYTNVLWLHYISDKLVNGAHYASTKTARHRAAMYEIMVIRDKLLESGSSAEAATAEYFAGHAGGRLVAIAIDDASDESSADDDEEDACGSDGL